MESVVLLLVVLGAAFLFGLPILLGVLLARTRRLGLRLDALERELRAASGPSGVRRVHQAPEARETAPPLQERERTDAREEPEPGQRTGVRDVLPVPTVSGAPQEHRSFRLTPPAAPLTEPEPESLETAIGTRWLLYIGIIAIVVGIAYFEKLAIEFGWIGETARVIQGAVVGAALMFAGTRFVKRGYAVYGQMMAGGGGAILYLSTYAAFNFYSLIARPLAFVLMVAITVIIAWLADRQRSQGLALFAVGGGFATPFLLPGTTDAQVALFTYDAILIAGTAVLSHRRDWPFLHLISYVFMLLTVAAWADRFYTPAKYLRTELYLTLYCAMFLYIAWQCRRAATDAGRVVALVLWTAPAAYYLASLAVLVDHDTALLVWLVLVTLTGGILSTRFGSATGLVTWLAAAVPLLMWCTTGTADGMRREGLITVAAVYVVALLAELEDTALGDEPRPAGAADVAWLHLNPLMMYAGAYLLLSPVSLERSGYLAAGFALWNAVLAGAWWRRRLDLAVHFLAVGFTLAAIAIALIYNGAAVTAGWAVEGAVVIVIAMRQRVAWLRIAGALLFILAVGQTLELLWRPVPAAHTILFNSRVGCAALVVALCYVLAWLDWRDRELPSREIGLAAALLTAQFVTLMALTTEINAYWARYEGHFQKELMLSVSWGLYATVLVVIGLARDYAPIRYFAITVLAVTITKVFFFDMAELDRIYRVGSIVALGVLLLVTSYLYSRSRRGIDDRNGRL